MINMTAPGYNPSIGDTLTRARTMFMTVPALQQMAQSDDVNVAQAALSELAQRGMQMPMAKAPGAGIPAPGGAAEGAAPVPTPLQRVAGGAMMSAPWNRGYETGEPMPVLPGNTANHPPARPSMTVAEPAPTGIPGRQRTPTQTASVPPATPTEAIKAGVDAADEAQDPMGDMSPTLRAAMQQAEAFDPGSQQAPSDGTAPNPVNALATQLAQGSSSPWSALAKAGFAMASSRSPWFFGALGEGANAGIDEFERQRSQDLLNRVRAAGLMQDQQRLAETSRSNRVQEGFEGQKTAIANRNMQLAEQDYLFKKQQYEEGKATDLELKRAEIAMRQAQAQASLANAAESGSRANYYNRGDLIGGTDGQPMRRIGADNVARSIVDEKGNPITDATKFGQRQSAVMDRATILRNAGWTEDQIAGSIGGGGAKTMTRAQMMNAASNYAKNMTAGEFGPDAGTKAKAFYDEAMRTLGGEAPAASVPAASAPAAPASGSPRTPTYRSPQEVKAAYQSGQITKEQAAKILQDKFAQ